MQDYTFPTLLGGDFLFNYIKMRLIASLPMRLYYVLGVFGQRLCTDILPFLLLRPELILSENQEAQ